MKIYPSKHTIAQTSKVNMLTDIPLAYINTDYKDYAVKIKGVLDGKDITPVLPYQTFASQDIVLFKPIKKGNISYSKDFEPIDNKSSVIQRVGDAYQYIPANATNFSPQEFVYSIVAKKNLEYRTQRNYNLKIASMDDPFEMAFSRNLIKIFGDAPARGICPSNVWVNNKDMSAKELINASMRQTDFIFIESPEGVQYKNTEEPMDINFMEYLNKNTNVWVSVDKLPIPTEAEKSLIQRPVLYNKAESNCKTMITSAISESVLKIPGEEKETVTMHYIFDGSRSAAIIKEYKNKGFVIYTDATMINQVKTEDGKYIHGIEQNTKTIYEILMYVYSKCYLESEKTRTWITDKAPDYVVINNELNKINKFISVKQIHKFFDMPSTDIAFSKIIISEPNIRMSGIANDFIVFEKRYTGDFVTYADPPKPKESMISIYTPQRTIMYFDDFVYSVEDNIEESIKYARVENSIEFNFRNFKHTSAGINISSHPFNDIQIPLVKTINYEQVPIDDTSFYLCSNANIVSYCEVSNYDQQRFGIIIAMITIAKTKEDIQIYDMRNRGGGLPKEFKDDHNLLDIGNLSGLAYRKSGALVITLPKRLEKHKDIIEGVVKRHMIAEKYPVILFEEDDNYEQKENKE